MFFWFCSFSVLVCVPFLFVIECSIKIIIKICLFHLQICNVKNVGYFVVRKDKTTRSIQTIGKHITLLQRKTNLGDSDLG